MRGLQAREGVGLRHVRHGHTSSIIRQIRKCERFQLFKPQRFRRLGLSGDKALPRGFILSGQFEIIAGGFDQAVMNGDPAGERVTLIGIRTYAFIGIGQ